MVTKARTGWGPRLAAMTLWALTGAAAVLWGLRLSAPAPQAPLPAVHAPVALPDLGGLRQVLGAVTAAPGTPGAGASTSLPGIVLTGVVATSRQGQGVALLAVGGQPARLFRVGDTVREGMVLQSVEAERVHLGERLEGPATQTLALPALRRPTGS